MTIKKGTINIPSVTGNIIITVTASKVNTGGGNTGDNTGGNTGGDGTGSGGKPCTKITLYPTKYTFDVISGWYVPVATVTPSDTTDIIQWSTSDATVATVTTAGVIMPKGNGSCVITATCGSQSATCNVTVNDINVGVTLTDINLNKDMRITSKDNYVIEVVPTPESLKGTGNVRWLCDNLQVLGLSDFEGEPLTLYPGKNGTANLEVTYDVGSKGKITKTFQVTVSLTDNTPNADILYNNPTIVMEGTKAKATQNGVTQYFDVSYMENNGHPSYNSYLTLNDNEDNIYYLALTNKGTSPFGKNGLHLDSGGWYNKGGEQSTTYPMQHSVLYFNDFNMNLTVKNVNNSVPSELLNKTLEVYNQTFPGLNMTVDNSSRNTVELVEVDDNWLGVNSMYEGTRSFVNQLNATQMISSYGPYDQSSMSKRKWLGTSVHEFGHTLGLKDNAAHYPTMFSYDRDREKCYYLQPNDIVWVELLHKNTYGVDLTKSQEQFEAQTASLNLSELSKITFGDQYNFEYPEFNEENIDLIVECYLEYVETKVLNISKNPNSNVNLEYRIYNIVNENVIKGEVINNQVKIHISQLTNLDTSKKYRLYLNSYENTPCSLINPIYGIEEIK